MRIEAFPVAENLWSPEVIEQKRRDGIEWYESVYRKDEEGYRRAIAGTLRREKENPLPWAERFLRKVFNRPYRAKWKERLEAEMPGLLARIEAENAIKKRH